MTMPSSAALLHAGTSFSNPSTSTAQTRQAPISLSPFKKHRCGIAMWFIWAASRIVVPSGT